MEMIPAQCVCCVNARSSHRYICVLQTVVFGVVYLMSSLNDSADRFKKSLQRSQSGPEVKRKAIGATEKLSEGKRTQVQELHFQQRTDYYT